MSIANYLELFLDPMTEAFTPELARKVIDLRLDEKTEQHITDLREKANRGTLTPEEDADYKAFVEAVDLVSVFQAKARRYLASHKA